MIRCLRNNDHRALPPAGPRPPTGLTLSGVQRSWGGGAR